MSLRLPPPVVTSFPHQEGLGAQPGRDESSLGPSAGPARDPEPDPGGGGGCAGEGEQGLLGSGLGLGLGGRSVCR